MARTKNSNSTRSTRKSTTTKPAILNAKTRAIIDEISKSYPDTEGMELSEPIEGATEEEQLEADRLELAQRKSKEKAVKTYSGPDILCTKLFVRDISDRFQNCRAVTYLAWNELEGTVTFCNEYQGRVPASFDPTAYRHKYNLKVHDKKMAVMRELPVNEWPSAFVNAHGIAKKHRRFRR